MAIHYTCKHCKHRIGTLNDVELTSQQLGFHELTHEERQEMIVYDNKGDIHVKTVCEDCQEALDRNPDYYALHSFIQ
ncbi:anti-sigma-F factor Fin family protein [Fictibacillus sp. Mic-4]|uniref:anti-sigma-F factor Fin family protein n=1 Tax=Fictibacillus TaxID=1329200 RepID=UPI000419416B|nr:anti-sigma-F factor Fin family protein [Fictibacillus gelatini]